MCDPVHLEPPEHVIEELCKRKNVVNEICDERLRQKGLWLDENNTPFTFMGYIVNYASRFVFENEKPTKQVCRENLIKVAALALAAIEHLDADDSEITLPDAKRRSCHRANC